MKCCISNAKECSYPCQNGVMYLNLRDTNLVRKMNCFLRLTWRLCLRMNWTMKKGIKQGKDIWLLLLYLDVWKMRSYEPRLSKWLQRNIMWQSKQLETIWKCISLIMLYQHCSQSIGQQKKNLLQRMKRICGGQSINSSTAEKRIVSIQHINWCLKKNIQMAKEIWWENIHLLINLGTGIPRIRTIWAITLRGKARLVLWGIIGCWLEIMFRHLQRYQGLEWQTVQSWIYTLYLMTKARLLADRFWQHFWMDTLICAWDIVLDGKEANIVFNRWW